MNENLIIDVIKSAKEHITLVNTKKKYFALAEMSEKANNIIIYWLKHDMITDRQYDVLVEFCHKVSSYEFNNKLSKLYKEQLEEDVIDQDNTIL